MRRYVNMLERHVLISQQAMSPMDRQALARWGVLCAYRLLKQHSRVYDALLQTFLELPASTGEKLDVARIFAAMELEHRKMSTAHAISGKTSKD